jgi:hypothetical protein
VVNRVATSRGGGSRFRQESDEIRFAIGSLHARLARQAESVRDAEFKAFSQWGEDGIIQHLINVIPIEHDRFVEIGVESYAESNTRFLAMHDNWRGLIIDGGTAHIDFVQRDSSLGWRHDIEAVSAFVTAENVNDLLAEHGVKGDLGLLSIDIDGMDYWVWRAISAVTPRILVIEFNSVLGSEHAVTVPYNPDFEVLASDPSAQYYGASLKALEMLGFQKGMRLVGVNSQGVNAFFVREDLLGPLRPVTAEQAYVRSRFRTARDATGALTFQTDHRALLQAIRDRVLYEIETGRERAIAEIYGV